MDSKTLIQVLGFMPKDGAIGIFQKKYPGSADYVIEIDVANEKFNYGDKIISERKTTLNFSQAENWVVLECVDRLLEKGYQPQNIILEKTWPSGHGTSGRLDILVTRKDGTAYMMIECKTYGTEYEKALRRLYKDGGQLFTYFRADTIAEVLILYTSELQGKEIAYKNEIIKIEEDYRQTANVKDLYDRWSKLTKNNGAFDDWVLPYEYKSKALTRKDLKPIRQEDSSFIFNRFLEILRHNVVSDKPNAFNKIFTLFLCKIMDEFKNDNEELHFQFLEGKDDHVSFQKRLTDLYNKGMKELLEKTVTDISDEEIDRQFFGNEHIAEFKRVLTEIRLKKNNEFAIKEVFDTDSFNENAKVVKEVVELLQGYQIRYNYRQQFLSDFFELLLTTGLKQESGQFFTPVPVARFIIKSLPLRDITAQKIAAGNTNDLLPNIIDYAAGSGHFLTESMEELQKYIDTIDLSALNTNTAKKIKAMRSAQFDWALDYVYGIEKDYRLVKTTKVSCYLHGDGLANIIHGDGLGHFTKAKEYKAKLKVIDPKFNQDNKQFDIIVSNPPYSVSAFKGTLNNAEESFELYDRLTDQSSEIECLFVERTKQLLKDGGIAGVILPSSILSNTGIYTRTREIILQYFEIIAIAELGSNTFMATGTNTVVLFLRRRNNYDPKNIRDAVKKALADQKDSTINGIEHPITKYINHVWEGITLSDYLTLLSRQPNEAVQKHDIYREYDKKIIAPQKDDKWKRILDGEEEKIYYFILTYHQKVVLVKTGEKNEEKAFLGYEFSNRRGNEGIHPIQRGKNIDECTRLFDPEVFDNPEKASTYIYKAFQGQYDTPHPSLAANIHHLRLIDMMTFDRLDFEKNISLAVKKKVTYEQLWGKSGLEVLNNVAEIKKGTIITEESTVMGEIPVIAGGKSPAYFHNKSNREGNIITVSASGANAGYVNYFSTPIFASDCVTIKSLDEKIIPTKLLYYYLNSLQVTIYGLQRGQAQPHVYAEDLAQIKIPLPPLDIQHKIVAEIEVLEEKERKGKDGIGGYLKQIYSLFDKDQPLGKISDLCKISHSKVDPQSDFDKQFVNIGLENIESNTGKIINKPIENGREILSTKNSFQKGDVLYGKLRPYLNKVAIPDFEGICSTDILVLKTENPVLLKYILLSEDVVKQTSALMSGVSLPRINVKSFLEVKIPAPSKQDQQKIVSQIQTIEKQIATLEAELAAIPQQKEQVLKKYL